eukprot:TRINITY_DN65468_c0_g1_i1.p1 TRINITY_DN65468_c0_g1~~TRINITY_DN65468_c0_g1_i1.p1  ORF type:complete len:336 (-),score=45.01 TRINITY_DN65468_c0_g1_i1:92-955(-)
MPRLDVIAEEDLKLAQNLQNEEDELERALVARRYQMTRTKACICSVVMFAFMISVATIFALLWVLLSVSDPNDEDAIPTWVRVYKFDLNQESSHVYAVAFHWAISKFTLSSVEPTLTPQNSTEKVVDLIAAFFSILLAYPCLGSMIALVSKLAPIFPGKDEATMMLLKRLGAYAGLILVQWLIFAGVWTGMPGSTEAVMLKITSGNETDVFRQSGEKDFLEGLHWSLCQFSLGSLTIMPPSYQERLASIFVQLIGLWTIYPLIAATLWTVFRLFPRSLHEPLKPRKM